MAIEDQNTQFTGQQSDQAAPAQQGELRQTWNFHQASPIGVPVATSGGGEYLNKIREAMAVIFKDVANGLDVKLITLNRHAQAHADLRFSALVVAVRWPDQDQNTIGYHTLILEATGDALGPVNQTLDNYNVMVRRVTGDAFDSTMASMAHQAVSDAFPNKNVYEAAAMVLPRNIQPDNLEVLTNVGRNCLLAGVNAIFNNTPQRDNLNLAYMDRECRFTLDITVGQHQVRDVVNNPQRSSVLVAFSSIKKTAGQYTQLQDVNTPDAAVRVCELSGFVQPIWAPPQDSGAFGFGAQGWASAQQQPQFSQKFVAELVITAFRSEYNVSLAAVLLSFSTALVLSDENRWVMAFLANKSAAARGDTGKVDITDIGALNVTANLANETDKQGFGTPISMETFTSTPETVKYVASLFRPGLVISLDCPEVGDSTWYLQPFALAAQGDKNEYNRIYEAADALTNGKFSQYFQHGTPIHDNVMRVPLGYYSSGNQTLDVRNIDYTAMCNMWGTTNPSVIHEYANTFVDRPGFHPMRNLSIRENIISETLHQQVEFTGYAARVTLSSEFIQALSQAVRDCNLPTTVNTPLSSDQMRTGVSGPSYINRAVTTGTQTFSSGYPVGRPAGPNYRYGGVGGSNFRRS